MAVSTGAIEALCRRLDFDIRETWAVPYGEAAGRSMWRDPRPATGE